MYSFVAPIIQPTKQIPQRELPVGGDRKECKMMSGERAEKYVN